MKKEIIIYILIIFGVLLMGLVIYGLFDKTYTNKQYTKALASEQEDICATPQGYTDEQWKEHMSHHPDSYKNCLGG